MSNCLRALAAAAATLAVGLAFLLLSMTTQAATFPSMTLTPSQGPEGTSVRVVGSGFCSTASGCSAVSISIARIPETTAPVASDGTFTATFKVPGGLSYGQQNVEADQTTASRGQLSANKTFFVTISQQSPPPSQSPPPRSPSATPSGSPSPSGPGLPAASAIPTAPSNSPVLTPPPAGSSPPSQFPWWAVIAGVVAVGAAAVVGLLWRRSTD